MFKKDPLLKKNYSPHSPHCIIPNIISPNSTVLDVGCNTGFLGRELLKKHVISDGIDINKKALEKAKKWYRNVFIRDLYSSKTDLGRLKYDFIVFADVLEHLPRPDLLLLDCKKHLKPGGKIIASLPNTARLEIRLNLLLGKFDYTYGGILSEDHLRFFTKKSAVKMFTDCGYRVESVIPTGLGHKLRILPNLTAFQFIYVVTKI